MAQFSLGRALIEEPPILVTPSLAKAVGLVEAVVLQTIFTNETTIYEGDDGEYYTQRSIRSWKKELPFLNEKQLEEAFKSLHKKGCLVTDPIAGYRVDAVRIVGRKTKAKKEPAAPAKNYGLLYQLLKHWNNKAIIQHGNLTPTIKNALVAALNDHGADDIMKAFDTYKAELESSSSILTYKWTLVDFLQKKLDIFVPKNYDPKRYWKRDATGKSVEQVDEEKRVHELRKKATACSSNSGQECHYEHFNREQGEECKQCGRWTQIQMRRQMA